MACGEEGLPDDRALLRRAIEAARAARAAGEMPFAAILTDRTGAIVMEQANAYSAAGGDLTAHAEALLASRASRAYPPHELAGFTLYSSCEPCAMCAGAIYWAGIGRVVFGQSEADLKRMASAPEMNPTLDLPCRTVFAAGTRRIEVVGPLLEEEARAVQDGFWEGYFR